MKRILCSMMTLMCFSILTGCSGKTTISYMKEDVTLDFVNRISVLPLENNTDQKYAAELARDVINTQILAMNIFDTVDKGIVDSVLHEEAISPGAPVSQLMLNRVGQRLNVQSIMVGSVNMAGDKRIGSVIVPEMSLTLRLIEIKSGFVLWQASGHYSGDSVLGRLFGITPDDPYKVTVKLVKKLLSTIPERQNVPLPVAAEPVAVVPAAVKPVVVKPVSVTTDITEPVVDVAEPAAAGSETAEPLVDVAEPAAAGSETAEPAAVEAEPATVEPVAAEPAAVEAEPVMIEPKATEPVVEAEPAAAEPGAVEP